ncbi:hypothetical protein [Kitasatospora sp. NPDC091276]|uniref:hypothetical protein n=1 Tax=Kitasatospora sp. NPDC091276 TaxID=3155300 RepID=UPI003415D49A
MAVITGEPGTGRGVSAIRAIELHLPSAPKPAELFHVAQDWDDDETPDQEILPDPAAGRGYLLDTTLRSLPADTVHALISWAERLHAQGSCVVIIGRPSDWSGDPGLAIAAVRPDAVQVARNHLHFELGSPDQAEWLEADPKPARSGLFGGTANLAAGVFSGLITRGVRPTDAVAMAERLHRVTPERLERALQHARDKQSAQDASKQQLQAIQDEVREWSVFLERVLTEAGTRGQDRVMLLAGSYLENGPVELCIKVANAFGDRDEGAARRFREGRSPRRRMQDVGVDVSDDDRAVFDRHPGLAMAAIRMDWHHWADERSTTREWLLKITAPGAVAAKWAQQIGDRLLELSRTAIDGPFFPIVEAWAGIDDADRSAIVSGLMARAASTPELARKAHKTLLDWAKASTESRRAVVADVCSGSYRQTWPHSAFTRLRHLLAYDDAPARTAAQAVIMHGSASGTGLVHVVNTVDTWLDRYAQSPTSARAFLALADPEPQHSVLPNLLTLARSEPQYRDFLIEGWRVTLSQHEVRDQAHDVLVAWARAAYDDRLDPQLIFELLTDVRNAHTPLDAMSRFLYGHPDREDPALIGARLALANVRACDHAACSRADCPVQHSFVSPPKPV